MNHPDQCAVGLKLVYRLLYSHRTDGMRHHVIPGLLAVQKLSRRKPAVHDPYQYIIPRNDLSSPGRQAETGYQLQYPGTGSRRRHQHVERATGKVQGYGIREA